MFEHKNEYPVILVPGFAGYGETTIRGKLLPYFGRLSASAQTTITSMGLECHTPTFGTLSSAWDRACELYAQIVGGTVDYGLVHSQKNGHARYGKTYTKPMVPNWGTLDAEGKLVKISLIAHGFGVVVSRLFIELMCNGSAEERNGTLQGDLSGLFMGGYTNIIHCLVSLAGVNSGITLFQAMQEKIPNSIKLLSKLAIGVEKIALHTQYVDPYYEKNGLTVTQYGFSLHCEKSEKKDLLSALKFNEAAIDNYLSRTEDNIFSEMGIDYMKKFNNYTETKENIYYLSAVGSVTKNLFNKVTLPTKSAGVLAPVSALVSTFENYRMSKPIVTSVYHENDGIVNTNSSLPPESEPVTAYSDGSDCVPGIWYQIPVENKNHLAFVGMGQRPDKYRNAIYDLIKIISNFDTI